MDTRLKKFSYGILWVLLLTAVLSAGIMASVAAAGLQVYQYNLDPDFHFGYYDDNDTWIPYDSVWTGEIADQAKFMDLVSQNGLNAVVLTVAAVILLVLACVFTGRFDREILVDDRGIVSGSRICLNWYDRIWSEIHIASVLGFGAGFAALVILLFELLPAGSWFGLFVSNYADAQYYGLPNDLAVALIVTAMVGCAVFCLTSLVSLVKKLKAGQFWEKSLIGGVLLFVWRGVRGSDRTTLKAVVYLLLLCAVAGFCGIKASWNYHSQVFWIMVGAGVCTLLILAVVPGKIRKFRAIRTAAAEIRGGNLACKVPVNPGRSGCLDELDRMALDLNHIGEAQQIAVASELKNQRMKTELISNVSHDLKTPLTSMSAYIDLLKKEGLNSENALEYLDIIDQKTQRLKVLTENLFEAAKASSGAMPVNITEIDLAALVAQSLAEMDEKLSARDLTVIVRNQCEDDPDGCRVLADGQLLWRIIENVLGNVSKYALPGSRVYVNLDKLVSQRPDRPGKVILDVKNISAEQLNISADELMERFKRGDESRNTEGSGLGLAIARDLAGLMNGVFEISIDGDLFKASVVLDEAVSARQIRAAKSAQPAGSDVGKAVTGAGHAASQAMSHAGQAAGNLMKKLRRKPAKDTAPAASAPAAEAYEPLQPIFEDTPVPEYEAVEE